jgi:hypothetical protein
MNYMSQCPHCYEWFHGSHLCSKIPLEVKAPGTFKFHNITVPIKPLTEERVREIIREELERAVLKETK